MIETSPKEIIKSVSVIPKKGKCHMQWIIATLVNSLIMTYGLQITWPISVSKALQSTESPAGVPLSTLDISWLASSPSLAAFFTIPVWAILIDKMGRKPCLIVCAVMQTISWVVIYFASNMSTLMFARVFGGLANGGCVYSMPMYIKEISQDDLRGTLGLVTNTTRNLGILFMYLLGSYLEYYVSLYIIITVSVIGLISVITIPESPTYYVKIGQVETAAKTIAYLRTVPVDHKDVQHAIDLIKAEDEKFKSIPNVTFFGIFKEKAWRKGFIFMFLLLVFHGTNGGFAIVNYAPTILEQFHVTVNPELQSLSVPLVMILGSIFSMVFIERLGRKPILGGSFLTAMLSFAALAALVVMQNAGVGVPPWIPVVVLAVPVFGYSTAVSPIPYVIMAEMFNFQIRAKVMGCLVMLGWAGAFVQILIFGPMTMNCGLHVTFIFFTITNIFGTAVVLVLLPETKGKTVEQIENELEKTLER